MMNNHYYRNTPKFLALFLLLNLFMLAMNGIVVNILFLGTTFLAILYGLVYKEPLKKRFILLSLLVIVYIIYGFGNPAWAVDSRYSITWLVFLYVFYNIFKHGNLRQLIKIVFGINLFIFVSYVLSSIGITFNFFAESQANIPAYMSYRTVGFSLLTIQLLPFLYLVYNLKKDKLLLLNGILGFIVIIMTGSGFNFAIFVTLYALLYMQFRTPKETLKNIFIIVVAGFLLVFYLMNFADVRLRNKYSKVFSPLEYASVQTRVRDLTYVLSKPRTLSNYIVGEGIGARTTIYRFNPEDLRQGGYRSFLEIDNGFYYIFHRFGLVGLLILVITHIKFIRRLDTKRAKLAFTIVFLVTNLLTIHYWVYPDGAIFIGVLLAANTYKKRLVATPTLSKNKKLSLNLIVV